MHASDLPSTLPDPQPGRSDGVSLDTLRPGRAATLRLLRLDCEPEHPDARRLALLGIRPGVELRVLHRPGPRGAVLGVGTARIALGRELVRRLEVAPAPEARP